MIPHSADGRKMQFADHEISKWSGHQEQVSHESLSYRLTEYESREKCVQHAHHNWSDGLSLQEQSDFLVEPPTIHQHFLAGQQSNGSGE
jgi:hypothetical protein